jgi:outer membrane protein TolC
VAQAEANYDAEVAAYRESVLTAFQNVEDNLGALRILADEATQQAAAVTASERSLALTRNRYSAGIATYLEVITVQNAAFVNERAAVDLRIRQMTASVNLIKALGGGWSVAEMPQTVGAVTR